MSRVEYGGPVPRMRDGGAASAAHLGRGTAHIRANAAADGPVPGTNGETRKSKYRAGTVADSPVDAECPRSSCDVTPGSTCV
ncbi:hypothetical protein CP973_17345 [Streptomyces albofaciens JCM 4342]|nr:hypothetical protein CP973_17345 [Streptomyces albofaciens JCM 4342]